jgi:Ammonia permease
VSIIGTLAILNVMKFFVSLRVEPQEEVYGLDLVLHGERVSE